MRCSSILGILLAFALTACQMAPPVVLDSDLKVTAALAELRPIDVAVLPVEDSSFDKSITPYLATMRKHISAALVVQRYSPLAIDAVDRGLADASGSSVDQAFLNSVAGRFEEDAVLGIRVTRWDARKIMQNARIEFSAEVFMIATKDQQPLWSGMVSGSIKAGGDGPSPIGESRRFESTAALFAEALIAELPERQL